LGGRGPLEGQERRQWVWGEEDLNTLHTHTHTQRQHKEAYQIVFEKRGKEKTQWRSELIQSTVHTSMDLSQ
jgi:hypothetical protein